MFGNTILSNRENATLQCRRFRNIATIIYPVSFGQSTTTHDQSQLHGMQYAGVIGAVDGTHIQIIAPSKDEDVFVNRKKVHTSTRRLLLMQLLTFLMWLQSGLGLPVIRVF
ncbi:hypothetical protein N1851_009653 [Merluccius polli]|uniref:DDE Tnp4 domain-containing protein n=1 Tax=Merluccius polli TaxID=89951 RepID=A0AA47NR22_MERPO|nr:hypothetical protein N1851_030150 [Merluccius polli]KAK0149594.1 hypothetical protein N1851_009653 [Merluccius polli]